MTEDGTGSTRWQQQRARALVCATMVLCAAALLSACGSASTRQPALTLYNGQHQQTTDALVRAFERATGITVAVRSDAEDTLAAQIAAEGARSPADVIYTENSPALQYLQGHGLLAPVARATLAATPSRYDSARGDWVGISARVSVLVYNPSLITRAQLPASVLDLAQPRYRGKLALAPSETDFQPVITAVDHQYGPAATLRWLRGMKANASGHVYLDNETVTNEVNRGVVALGVIDQYYWYRLRAQLGAAHMHSRIATFAPGDPGYVVDVSGAAVLRSSRHQAAAQRFLAFLVSRQGQEIIAHSTSFEYPLGSAVATARHEIPFAQLRPDPISVAQLGEGKTAVALLQQAGLL